MHYTQQRAPLHKCTKWTSETNKNMIFRFRSAALTFHHACIVLYLKHVCWNRFGSVSFGCVCFYTTSVLSFILGVIVRAYISNNFIVIVRMCVCVCVCLSECLGFLILGTHFHLFHLTVLLHDDDDVLVTGCCHCRRWKAYSGLLPCSMVEAEKRWATIQYFAICVYIVTIVVGCYFVNTLLRLVWALCTRCFFSAVQNRDLLVFSAAILPDCCSLLLCSSSLTLRFSCLSAEYFSFVRLYLPAAEMGQNSSTTHGAY